MSALRVVPLREYEPALLDADAPSLVPSSRWVQGTLAVDFVDADADEQFGPQRTRCHDLPEPTAWVRPMLTAVLQVMTGARSPAQVQRHLHPRVLGRVNGAAIAARRRQSRHEAIRVRSVRACHPRDSVVEVSAVVHWSGRVRAVALRLSGADGRWVITALEIG